MRPGLHPRYRVQVEDTEVTVDVTVEITVAPTAVVTGVCLCCGHVKNLRLWADGAGVGVCKTCWDVAEVVRGACAADCFCAPRQKPGGSAA